MPNAVDVKIAEITDGHTAECEKLNVSRNVQETKRRIELALADFSRLDILASGYWEGLGDAAKIAAIRAAVVEMAEKPAKPKTTTLVSPDGDSVTVPVNEGGTGEIEVIEKPKKARKAKAAA